VVSGTDPRSSFVSALRAVAVATHRALVAEYAASRAAAWAVRQERLADAGGLSAEIHARLAVRHRESERCQRVAARLQRRYAWSLTSWMARKEPGVARPVLLGAVAESAGWGGAVLTLGMPGETEALVSASDEEARRLHELEVAVGEGPSWEAMAGRCSSVSGPELSRRWPSYGAAVADLGVRAVAAVPVGHGADQVGSLTVTGEAAPVGWSSAGLVDLAEALQQVVGTPDSASCGDLDLPGLEQLESEDFQPALHQAAGVLSHRLGLPMEDGIALVRAHAYAEDRSVAEVAAEVLRGGLLEF